VAETEETTLVVKTALSAVARAERRGGLQAVAEMLRGAETAKTERFGFRKLSTFGLLKDRSQEWVLALLRALLAAGWVDLTPTEHPVPNLTRSGAGVMKGEAPARILLPREPRSSPPSRRRPRGERAELPPLEPDEQRLFELLRARRAEIAKQKNVPPYVVAHDRTLFDLARRRPTSRAALLEVHGMGPARVEQYGEWFLSVLAEA
jgi:ATP-dependent DNA helicase RecQ